MARTPMVFSTVRWLVVSLFAASLTQGCGRRTGDEESQPTLRAAALSQPLVIDKKGHPGPICIVGVGCETSYTNINDGVYNISAAYTWGADGTSTIGTIEVSGGEIVRVTSDHFLPVVPPVTTLTAITTPVHYQTNGVRNPVYLWGQDGIHPSAPQMTLLAGRRYALAVSYAWNPATGSSWLTTDGGVGPTILVQASGAVAGIDGTYFASFFDTTSNGFAAKAATVHYRTDGVVNPIHFWGLDTISPSQPTMNLIGGLRYGFAISYAWNPATSSSWLTADGQAGPTVLVQTSGAVSGLEGTYFDSFFETTSNGLAARETAIHYRTDGVVNPIHFWGLDTISPSQPTMNLIGGLRYGFAISYAWNPATSSSWLTADGQAGPTVLVQTSGAVSGLDGTHFNTFFETTSNGLAARETTIHYRADGVVNPIHFWGLDTISPSQPTMNLIGGLRYGFAISYAWNPATSSSWLTADGQPGPTVLVQTSGAISGLEGTYFDTFFETTSNGLAARETTIHYRTDGVVNPIHFWGLDTISPSQPTMNLIGGLRYGFAISYAWNPSTNSSWLTADGQAGPTVLVQTSGAISGLDGTHFNTFFETTSNGLAARETTIHYRTDGVVNPIHFWGLDTIHPSQPTMKLIGGLRYSFAISYAWNPATNSSWLTGDGQPGPTVLVQTSGAISGLDGTHFNTFFETTSNGLAARETTIHYQPNGTSNPIHFWGLDNIHPSAPRLTLLAGMRYAIAASHAQNPGTSSTWLTADGAPGPNILLTSSGAVHPLPGTPAAALFAPTPNGFQPRRTLRVGYDPVGSAVSLLGFGTLSASSQSMSLLGDLQYNIGGAWYTFPCNGSTSVTVPGATLPIACTVLATSVCEGLGEGAACEDGNLCTANSCLGGSCASTPLPAGSPCANGNVCNGAGACAAPTVGTDPTTGQPVPVGPPRDPQVATPTGIAGLPSSFGPQCTANDNHLVLVARANPAEPPELQYTSTSRPGCGFEICTDVTDPANPQVVFERNPQTPAVGSLQMGAGTPGCAAIQNDGGCPYEVVQPPVSCDPRSMDPAANPCPSRGQVCALHCLERDCSDGPGRYFCSRRTACRGTSLPAEGPETCTEIRECADPGNVATTPAANDVADPTFVAPRTDPTVVDHNMPPPPQGTPTAYDVGQACVAATGSSGTVSHGTPDGVPKLEEARMLTRSGPLGTTQGEGNWRINFGPGLLKHLTFNPLPHGVANPQLVVRADWHATATIYDHDFRLVGVQGEVSASFCGLRKHTNMQIMGQDVRIWSQLLSGDVPEPDVTESDECWKQSSRIGVPPDLAEQAARIRAFVRTASEVKKALEDALAVRRDFIHNNRDGNDVYLSQAWSKLRTPSIGFLINTFKKLSRTVPRETSVRESMDDLLATLTNVSFEAIEALDAIPAAAPQQGAVQRRNKLIADLNAIGYRMELALAAINGWMARYETKINEFLAAPRQLFPVALRTRKTGFIDISQFQQQFLWTLPPINFAVGPVPVTAGLEISANAGVRGGLRWSVKADKDPAVPTDTVEPHATGALSVIPLVDANLSAFVGVGFESSLGGASAGISGQLKLIGFRTDFSAEMGVERSAKPDMRSIAADYQTYGNLGFHVNAEFYEWQPAYKFVATGHLDLMSGQLDAYARIRVWPGIGKTFKKRIVSFKGTSYALNWGQIQKLPGIPGVVLPSPFSYRAEVKFPRLPDLPTALSADQLAAHFTIDDPIVPGALISLEPGWGLGAGTGQTREADQLGYDACEPSPACPPGQVQTNGVCCQPGQVGENGSCVCPAPTVLYGNSCLTCEARAALTGDDKAHYSKTPVNGDNCVVVCSNIPPVCGVRGYVSQNGVCVPVVGQCVH